MDEATFGGGHFLFTAGPGQTTFAITDEALGVTGVEDPNDVNYGLFLNDANGTLYTDENQQVSGSLFGTLTPGDTYDFQVIANLRANNPASMYAAPSITFSSSTTPTSVTPEPSSFLLLGTGLLGVAGAVKRRFVQL